MLNKTIIALSVALAMGAASTAMADYEYDGTGTPSNMHIVDAQQNALANIFASTRGAAPQARAVAPFTAAEKELFDRQSWSRYNEGR
jgi:hypothetical protein